MNKHSGSDKSIEGESSVENIPIIFDSNVDSVNQNANIKNSELNNNDKKKARPDSPFNPKKLQSNQPNFLTKDEMMIKQVHKQNAYSMREMATGNKKVDVTGQGYGLGFPVILAKRQKHGSSRAVILKDMDTEYANSMRGIVIPNIKNTERRQSYRVGYKEPLDEFEQKLINDNNVTKTWEKRSTIIENDDEMSPLKRRGSVIEDPCPLEFGHIKKVEQELEAMSRGSNRFVDVTLNATDLLNKDVTKKIIGYHMYNKGSYRSVDSKDRGRKDSIFAGQDLGIIKEKMRESEDNMRLSFNEEINISGNDPMLGINEKDLNMKILQDFKDQSNKKSKYQTSPSKFSNHGQRNRSNNHKRNSLIDAKNLSPIEEPHKLQSNSYLNRIITDKSFEHDEFIENNAILMAQNLISYKDLQTRMENMIHNPRQIQIDADKFKAVDFSLNKKLMFDCDCFTTTNNKNYFGNYQVNVLEEFQKISHKEMQSFILMISKLNDLIKGAEEAYNTKKNKPINPLDNSLKEVVKTDIDLIKMAQRKIYSVSNRNVDKRNSIMNSRAASSNRGIISLSKDSKNSQTEDHRRKSIVKLNNKSAFVGNPFDKKRSQNNSFSMDKNEIATNSENPNKENNKNLNLPRVSAFNQHNSNRSIRLTDKNKEKTNQDVRPNKGVSKFKITRSPNCNNNSLNSSLQKEQKDTKDNEEPNIFDQSEELLKEQSKLDAF